MSTGTIVALVIAALVGGVFVPLRIAVAKQRRAVETVRARLAASKTVRRRAEAVAVEAIQKLGASVGRVSRSSTCALADDGLYCLSGDGRWGGRVRLAPGAPEIGDVVLSARPCLVTAGSAVAPGALPDWLVPLLAASPRDGLLLQFEGGLSWFVAVPEADLWFAALQSSLGQAAPPA